MAYTNAAKEAAALAITALGSYISLHTADPGTTGTSETTGNHVATNCKSVRTGTGARGKNGNAFNFERTSGTYTLNSPEIILDGAWPNPVIGGKRAYPNLPTPRHEGKFGHIIVIEGSPTIIVNDPIFDPWGHPGKGGFHVFRDKGATPNITIKRGGVVLSKVYLPQWWVAPASFDPAKQYYDSDQAAQSTVWG